MSFRLDTHHLFNPVKLARIVDDLIGFYPKEHSFLVVSIVIRPMVYALFASVPISVSVSIFHWNVFELEDEINIRG